MELKTKYQYTYFIYPYLVDSKSYDKYILKLLKDKNCKFKIFEKEKDLDIYNYFLPHFRNYIFPTFEFRGQKLKDFKKANLNLKSKLIANQTCACFDYKVSQKVKGKIDKEFDGIYFNIEKIEIICFKTGICFFTMKTSLDSSDSFYDLLDFNYKFKDINSELKNLKNFENIRIQTGDFKDVQGITELISKITGVYKRKNSGISNEFTNSRFYTFSYACVDSNFWNESSKIDEYSVETYKYASNLPSSYLSDYNKDADIKNLSVVDKYKYYKIYLTKLSSNLICSSIDTFNYTKLPYEYENQYFYTYIITLYQKLFLSKINDDFKEMEELKNIKRGFTTFISQLWEGEITLNDCGSIYYTKLRKELGLDELYKEIKAKYEVIYNSLNIEKNNAYYNVLFILLICSFALNLLNIYMIIRLV